MQLIEGYIDTQRGSFGNIGSFNILDSVELVLTITGGSKVWNNPIFELHAVKADKTEVRQTSNITIVDKTNKTIKIKLDEQMTTCLGILKLQLVIKDNDRTSSTIFKLNVNESLEYSTVRSANSIKIYADLEELNRTLTANENKRVEAESLREQAENSRNEAENTRVSKFNEIKDDWEIIKDDDYKLEVHNSRTSMFEGEKNTLDERLNTDFSEINKKFDEGQFIEYNDHNITASNSLAGYTKDMRIEGATYQNLLHPSMSNFDFNHETNKISGWFNGKNLNLIKPSTVYTLIINVEINSLEFRVNNNEQNATCMKESIFLSQNEKGFKVYKLTSKDDLSNSTCIIRCYCNGVGQLKGTMMLLEGDYTNKYIPPYFEGIKSVGEIGDNKISILSTGNNLLNINKTFGANKNVYTIINNGFIQKYSRAYISLKYCKLKPNTTYTISGNAIGEDTIGFRVEVRQNGVKISDSNAVNNEIKIFTTPSIINETLEVMIWASKTMTANSNDLNGCGVDNVQLEEGRHSTTYEPHKSDQKDILLPNPLRGLPNGIKDAIEFINDKWCYVQRVGKVILNGSETWSDHLERNKFISFILHNFNFNNVNGIRIISNVPYRSWNNDPEKFGIWFFEPTSRGISIEKSKLATLDTNGLKSWLKANPITVYYELEIPVITPINLNPNLISWEGTTHIFSENSISPSLSCKVSTNIPALLSDLKIENNCLKNDLISNNEMILNSSLYSLENDYRLTLIELGLL